MADRMFPLQTSRPPAKPGPTSIPWAIAEKAYAAYAQQYGKSQSLERLAERGGFGWCEMDALYPAWRGEVDELAHLRAENIRLGAANAELTAELARLSTLINSPHTDDFLAAVRLEAAHQVGRWPSEHDAGKEDTDWYWLIGYLGGKALHNPPKPGVADRALQLHRIITIAAAALNWHRARSGGSCG
jgi:hypothetical protein